MSKYAAFNLNQYVLVKLLPQGFEAMRAYYSYMPPDWQKPLSYYIAQANEAGYVKFQLWEFMRIFGPLITLATVGLFETDILLEQADLKPA